MLQVLDGGDEVVVQVQAAELQLLVQILDAANAIALQPQALEPRILLEVLDLRVTWRWVDAV